VLYNRVTIDELERLLDRHLGGAMSIRVVR
jgi:hypothetical protein